MNYSKTTEIKGKNLIVKYSGTVVSKDIPNRNIFEEFMNVCHENNLTGVLLDCRELTANIDTFNMFKLGTDLGKLNVIKIKFATIVPNTILKDDFIETVAENHGKEYKMFMDENDALEWLSQIE